MHQDNPNTYQLCCKVTQAMKRRLEHLAEQRGYSELAELVRAMLVEAVKDIELTAEDYRIIAARVDKKKEVLRARKARG